MLQETHNPKLEQYQYQVYEIKKSDIHLLASFLQIIPFYIQKSKNLVYILVIHYILGSTFYFMQCKADLFFHAVQSWVVPQTQGQAATLVKLSTVCVPQTQGQAVLYPTELPGLLILASSTCDRSIYTSFFPTVFPYVCLILI